MDQGRKGWVFGCGGGCLSGCGCFVLLGGLLTLASFLAWEYGGIKEDWNEPPLLFAWVVPLALLAGGAVGGAVTFLVKKRVS